MNVEMAVRIYGALVYSWVVWLAIIWAGVGMAYWRGGGKFRLWGMFTICMVMFAAMFAGLSIIASEPPWVSRYTMQWINRTLGLVAVISGSIFSWNYLRAEWRRTNGNVVPRND